MPTVRTAIQNISHNPIKKAARGKTGATLHIQSKSGSERTFDHHFLHFSNRLGGG